MRRLDLASNERFNCLNNNSHKYSKREEGLTGISSLSSYGNNTIVKIAVIIANIIKLLIHRNYFSSRLKIALFYPFISRVRVRNLGEVA